MNQLKKLTVMTALFTLAALRTNADTTNLVQDISVQLVGERLIVKAVERPGGSELKADVRIAADDWESRDLVAPRRRRRRT